MKAPATSSPIPIGWYQAQIVENEVRNARNGNGSYLLAVFEILDGEYRGRKIYQNITLQNTSQQAVEIGARLLTDIYTAIGHTGPTKDIRVMLFKPVMARAGIKRDGRHLPRSQCRHFGAAAGLSAQARTWLRPVSPGPVSSARITDTAGHTSGIKVSAQAGSGGGITAKRRCAVALNTLSNGRRYAGVDGVTATILSEDICHGIATLSDKSAAGAVRLLAQRRRQSVAGEGDRHRQVGGHRVPDQAAPVRLSRNAGAGYGT